MKVSRKAYVVRFDDGKYKGAANRSDYVRNNHPLETARLYAHIGIARGQASHHNSAVKWRKRHFIKKGDSRKASVHQVTVTIEVDEPPWTETD